MEIQIRARSLRDRRSRNPNTGHDTYSPFLWHPTHILGPVAIVREDAGNQFYSRLNTRIFGLL
jgi:hypothetical protein